MMSSSGESLEKEKEAKQAQDGGVAGSPGQQEHGSPGHSYEFEPPSEYADFTEDGDVIERIRSRASVSSDVRQIRTLRQKYREGFFETKEDDPRRPQNWPLRKQVLHTMAFGSCTCSALLAATVFAPAGFQVARQKRLGSELGVLAFCVYLLGNIIGPILLLPVAETFGRKKSVLVPGFITGILLCVCANADSMPALVVYRFLAGVFSSGPISCSSSSVADIFRPKYRASALTLFSMSVIIGITIPPIFGALLVDTGRYGWRWCAWLGGILNIVISTIYMLLLDETLLPVVESSLAQAIRLDSGFWGLHTVRDKNEDLSVAEIFNTYVKRPIIMLILPDVFATVLCSSFAMGVLFVLVTTAGEQFQLHYHFSFVASQCTLVGILIGFTIGCLVNLTNSQRYANLSVKLGRNPSPRTRLPPMMFYGWLLPAGLFVYGWTMRPNIHWIVPIIGLGLLGAGISGVFQGVLNYLADAYPEQVESTHAAEIMVRYVFAGIFPLFSRQLYSTLKAGWASSLLGFIAAALIPVPWILYFFHRKETSAKEAARG